MRTLDRRTVLAGLAGTLATAGCAPLPASSFPLGVAAGDALAGGALLWTQFTGKDALEVLVWPGAAGVDSASRLAVPIEDGFAMLEVSGLAARTWYSFRFESADGQVSPTGRFRTALAPDALETITIGATSCIKFGHAYDVLARAAERTDLDAFIFLGDAVYTDGSTTLADFRRKWAEGLAGEEYVALRSSTSMVSQWDDHEVRNNWSGDSIDPTLLANARRAFLDHQPIRRDESRPLRLWRSLAWGRTAELFILDSRSERNRAEGQYLSPEQLEWLISGVKNSSATFKLILNTVPIGEFDSAFFAPFNDDNWQGFPAQRRELLDGLEASGATGILFLSGDFHLASFGRVAKDGPGSTLFEALVGPGANAPNPLPAYPSGEPWEFSSAINNYTSFELDPISRKATVRYHSGDGQIIFERAVG